MRISATRALFLAGTGLALSLSAQESAPSCPMHDAHAPAASAQESDHHAKVAERGDHVMGFDHAVTTHHFLLSPTGGSIEVSANGPGDSSSRDAIRGHLAHIARMFAAGDFQAPMLIHDRVPPGVPAMQRKKSEIEWKYEETPAGARVVATTKDRDGLAAIHEFLRFQIEDHKTGDSPEVGGPPAPHAHAH